MTPQSQHVILSALRKQKRDNLAQARSMAESGMTEHNPKAQEIFEAHMALDDQIELAMQEIAVAR